MSDVKAPGSTRELHLKLQYLRMEEESGILGVAVECVDLQENIGGEGGSLF